MLKDRRETADDAIVDDVAAGGFRLSQNCTSTFIIFLRGASYPLMDTKRNMRIVFSHIYNLLSVKKIFTY